MKLWLARHAFAGTRLNDGKLDDARSLAPEGRKAAKAIGQYLNDLYDVPDTVYASTAQRATETGKIIADETGAKFKRDAELSPQGKLDEWLWYTLIDPKVPNCMVVTHSDVLQDALAKLTGVKVDAIEPWVMGEVRLYDVGRRAANWPLTYRIQPSSLIGEFQNRL